MEAKSSSFRRRRAFQMFGGVFPLFTTLRYHSDTDDSSVELGLMEANHSPRIPLRC